MKHEWEKELSPEGRDSNKHWKPCAPVCFRNDALKDSGLSTFKAKRSDLKRIGHLTTTHTKLNDAERNQRPPEFPFPHAPKIRAPRLSASLRFYLTLLPLVFDWGCGGRSIELDSNPEIKSRLPIVWPPHVAADVVRSCRIARSVDWQRVTHINVGALQSVPNRLPSG